ncbi:class I SAM-dependent methyltransferase, partial [Bacteriovoracaceae bacterium]|nr:class I SAM-dependent methyltransferase [Bacteriovoracaceae bacterium]
MSTTSTTNTKTTKLSSRKKESFKIFDDIAKTYDFLNHLLSMGIDIYWRNKLLKNVQKKSHLNALDLATGTGDLALTLSKNDHIENVLGMDLSEGMINVGRTKINEKGLSEKIQFQIGDACNIP